MDDKAQLEQEHSNQMNKEAVERVKKESLTKEEADYIERAFFEDDAEIRLRDGKTYKVTPASLKNARKLMSVLKTINVDAIILNYVPTEDMEADEKRARELLAALRYGFSNYPEITDAYLEEFVDLDSARKIIDVVIGINGLKK